MQSNLSLYKETNFNWVDSILLNDRIDAKNYKVEYLELQNKIISQTYFTLRDIIEDINNGFEVNRNYSDTGINYITVKDLKEFEIDYSGVKKINLHFSDVPAKGRLKEGDIIISRSGSIGIAKTITNNDVDSIISYDIMKLRVNNKIDRDYLTTYLNSNIGRKLIEQLSYGAVLKKIGQEEFLNLLISIPSPEIQKYIGDKVRKAEELREEAKRMRKEADEILKVELGFNILQVKLSVYKEKFSWIKTKELDDRMDGEFYKTDFILNNEHIDILKNNGVQVLRLKDIIDKGSYGILPSSDDYGKGEVVLLRSTNLKEFLIDASDVIKVPECYYKEKVQVNEGDILLEIKGQCYSGAIATELKNKTIVNGSIYKFSVKKGFNNYYILAYLLSKSGQLQKQQNLANSIISYLSIDCINNLNVPVISMEKQQIIGGKYKAYVEQMNKSKQLIQEAKQDVEDLIEGNFDMSKVRANS